MTGAPMGRKPTEGRQNTRDWFAPPPSQPTDISDITYSGPLPQPAAIPIPGTLKGPRDRRVWPPEPEPEPEEEQDRSTQPFPALRGTRPATMPPPIVQPSPTPPPPAPPDIQQPDVQASPAEPPAAGHAVTLRGRRTALLGAGALVAVVLAVGLPGWFGYRVFQYGQPEDQIHTIQPGQAGTWQHVSWQVTLERIPDPTGKPATSDRQWMKVVATRTALDGEGAIRHGAPEVRLTDRSGRIWLTQGVHDETPPDTTDNKVGTPYRIELMGVVPPSVAGEVQVLLRPSSARSVPGQSVADMMKDSVESEEKMDQVLRFLR
ncbi:hypothetical protein [Planotetraspora sp. GP83]|uniref:hypothetical protein n=1 Tax=Planotetraspora sp. GP83 TaxID=3156264 RepID=UPI0035135C69